MTSAEEVERHAKWVEGYGTQTPVREIFDGIATLLRTLLRERNEARFLLREAEKALEPFATDARWRQEFLGTEQQDTPVTELGESTVGHLRAAAAAYDKIKASAPKDTGPQC